MTDGQQRVRGPRERRRALLVVAGLVAPLLSLGLSAPALTAVLERVAGAWRATGADQRGALALGGAAAVVLVLAGHVLRAARTKEALDGVRRGPLGGHVRALAVGYALGLALPLRLGELVRALLLARQLGVSRLYTVVVIAVERLVDVVLVGLGLLLLSATVLTGATAASLALAASAVVLASALLVLLVRLAQEDRRLLRLVWRSTGWLAPRLEGRVRFALWSLISGVQRFTHERARVRRYLLWTALSWACYLTATLVLAGSVLGGSGPGPGVRAAEAGAPYAVASPALGPALPGRYVTGVADTLAAVVPDRAAVLAYASASWLVLAAPVAAVGWVCLLGLLVRRGGAPRAPLSASSSRLDRVEDASGSLPTFLDAYFARDGLARVMHDLEVRGRVALRRSFKGGSNAVTVLVSRGEELFVTKVVPPEHAARLKQQYDWLVARRGQRHLVTALREESAERYYAIDLEYRPSTVTLHEYVHTRPEPQARARLEEVWHWVTTAVHRTEPAAVHAAERDAYVEQRLVRRVRAAAGAHAGLREALAAERLVVNGTEHDGFEVVLARIRSHRNAWTDLATYQASSAVHGDLTVDNVLVDLAEGEHGAALVLDPSDDNEVRGPVIDAARQLQSLRYGYEFLLADEEPVALERRTGGAPSITYADRRSARYAELDEHVTTRLLPRHLTGVEQRTVLFHVGLFYGRMLTHRVVIDPGSALKYLGVSVRALNAFIDQYDLPLRDPEEVR